MKLQPVTLMTCMVGIMLTIGVASITFHTVHAQEPGLIEPAADEGISQQLSTEFSDDFSTDPNSNGRWTVHRWADDLTNEANWDSDNGVLFLTRTSTSKAGVMFADHSLVARRWKANFKYKAGGGTGSDGFVFMFYKNSTAYGTPANGNYLGFHLSDMDPLAGYGIEFDNYYWPAGDPSENHIAIIEDTVENHLTSVNDSRTEDNVWHNVVVDFDHGLVKVYVDEALVINHTITNVDYTYTGVGFGGSTGAYTNNHVIDDFVLQTEYSISGQVLGNGQSPVPDVHISVVGQIVSDTTASDGTYLIDGLAAGIYDLFPSKANYIFEPVSRTVTLPPDTADQDFTAIPLYTISGRVKQEDSGQPLGDVAVSLNQAFTVTTNASGYYTFTDILSDTYVVQASKSYYSFEPVSYTVTVPPSVFDRDFIARQYNYYFPCLYKDWGGASE